MTWIVTKYLLTAAMVVFISEVAKRSDKLGGFIAALPLMTLLTLTWLFIENQSEEKVSNHAYYTFWYVIPTLPMFLAFPYLLPKLGFLVNDGGLHFTDLRMLRDFCTNYEKFWSRAVVNQGYYKTPY